MTLPTYENSLRDATNALQAGWVEAAFAAFSQARALSRTDAQASEAEMAQAVCRARARQWPEAVRLLGDLAARHPGSGIALTYLGAARFELGEIDRAREELDAAVRLAPNEALVYVKRGEVSARLGLIREALVDFRQAARLPIADETTLAYVRSAILTLRRELDHAIERRVPPFPNLVARFRRRRAERVIERTATAATPLAWREP